ncbi:MAG: hypothetical protein RJP96_02660 [Algiphilus sp.]|uniref:hypothetical protein n=1 Tax=Algiphilus sp. TaxID=1872431 RepID=UPI0032EED5CE
MSSLIFQVITAQSAEVRGERINVGVVGLPSGGRPLVRFDASPARLRAINADLARLNLSGWATDLEETLIELQDQETQLAMLPVLVRPFTLQDQQGYSAREEAPEAVMDRLFQRLVLPERATISAPKRTRPASKLEAELRTWLRKAHAYSTRIDDIEKHKVVGNYPVDPIGGLYADFALMNGSLHFIEALDFRGAKTFGAHHRGRAALAGVTLDEAKERWDGDGKRIALISTTDMDVARPAIHMVERYADQIWDMGSSAHRQHFATFVADALHRDADELDLFHFAS